MQRYYTQSGSEPKVELALHIAGPQMADQIPEEVRRLLDREGVKEVAVLTDYGIYPGITLYRKIVE